MGKADVRRLSGGNGAKTVWGEISGKLTITAKFNISDLPAVPGYYVMQLRCHNDYNDFSVAFYTCISVDSETSVTLRPSTTAQLAQERNGFMPSVSSMPSFKFWDASISSGKIVITMDTSPFAVGYHADSINAASFAMLQQIEIPD
ncbi:hypothetical protein AAEU42_07290 [Pseudoflavonifractor phocaeensis]|uniref:hypothetical protein n=1 Tax=Pseudoflavonifractor phocaeensis TaxID=1870988 RepID=UPI00313AFF68